MKRHPLPPWSVLFLALSLAVAASTAMAQSSATGVEQQMSPEEFKAAGLHKLSAEELAVLDAWMRRQHAGETATPAAAATPAPLPAGVAVGAAAAGLSAAEVERLREEAREEGRREVKEENRGFFDFGSDEPIKSNLVGEFRGFAKGNRYTLANGQVWEQLEPARLDGVRNRNNPAVTIKPGLLNVWYLRLDGYNTPAKVRRVK
ncbi:hypothetical protein [Pseudoxanthomonas koreensis]|uniref:hypothetical protein n=1 Tax=Pseudoxanthomonas koreensis TaxID=266061 RepID=UPI001391417C|nr:hypothetical protein [Pseudoxanthomonas koreensis]KAF1691991.1 hypothetical protein CSC64_07840 [Pseudoxanthomonas koreensis]